MLSRGTYRSDTNGIECRFLFHQRTCFIRAFDLLQRKLSPPIRRFSHSVTNRFTHSTTKYRYQFKFLRSCTPTPELGEMPLPSYSARCTTPCNRVSLPLCRFPSTLPRKNRAEMPLNYTNPIESSTPYATSRAMT